MDKNEMKRRTRTFALRVINLVEALPKGQAANVIGYQLLKSGTSVGANYRSACRAKSKADFISKLGTVEEEADECIYWMELSAEAKLMPLQQLKRLMREADEVTAIVVGSLKTARRSKD